MDINKLIEHVPWIGETKKEKTILSVDLRNKMLISELRNMRSLQDVNPYYSITYFPVRENDEHKTINKKF